LIELSEYELQFLDNQDAFFWKEKAKQLQCELELWRTRYHQLALSVVSKDDIDDSEEWCTVEYFFRD